MISQRVHISIKNIGKDIKNVLAKKIIFNIEGKCIVEGFVNPGSCKIISYSSGELSGSSVVFEVVVECMICNPVEGMVIRCKVTNITDSAGIKAETEDSPSPVIIYIARDHHVHSDLFSTIEAGNIIQVRTIGQRFELNDTYVSVIADLIGLAK